MSCCSCGDSGIAPRLLKSVQAKLREIDDVMPGTRSCAIIKKSGEVIPQNNNPIEQIKPQDLINIFKLKEASMQLGETLPNKEKDCSIIHIRGDTTVFSLYDIGLEQDVLAIFTQMFKKDNEKFDFTSADQRISLICEELKQMIGGHHSQRS